MAAIGEWNRFEVIREEELPMLVSEAKQLAGSSSGLTANGSEVYGVIYHPNAYVGRVERRRVSHVIGYLRSKG